jgi:hypothetical protein
MAEAKEVRYLNKDFFSFRDSLMNFAKVYYPTTYRDFNETSPGMMFIEMGAYVGDVLSFYIDKQFRESFLYYAEEPDNIKNFAYTFGYRPKTTSPATVTLDVFQLCPAVGAGSASAPDWNYAVKIRQGMSVQSNTSTTVFFRTTDDIDFKETASLEVTVYSIGSDNNPTYYLLKKSIKAIAGRLRSEDFSFSDPQRFQKVLLGEDTVTEIYSVTDSDGYTWYEVPYLAQDTIIQGVPNTAVFDANHNIWRQETPYLLKLRKVPRRFEVRVRGDGKTELRFGSGVSDNADEELVPNTSMLSSPLPDGNINFSQNIDPTNFLFTKTYGQIPHNTTLTVQYYYGGGAETNVVKDNLTVIDEMTVDFNTVGLNTNLVNQVRASIACTNPVAGVGGRGIETNEEIRLNAMANFAAQNRAVTREDYITRVLSMPAKFGSVAKAFIVPDTQLSSEGTLDIPNYLGMNLYLLGYDINGRLTTLNPATQDNVKIYLDQYRMITDAINIKDAFIVNIGVSFKIVVLPKYNKNEVLLRAVDAVRRFFVIDKWQINQPIILADLITTIASVEGVQSIIGKPEIGNLWRTSQGYSGNLYNIPGATMNDVVYPSLDPSIFEVRFPDVDIKGQVVTY